jgi:uncharacterized membrane protein (DUF485 family)
VYDHRDDEVDRRTGRGCVVAITLMLLSMIVTAVFVWVVVFFIRS